MVEPRGPTCRETSAHWHDGSEFSSVMERDLAIHYQSEEHILRAGDSVYFDASEPHSYCGKPDNLAKAVIVASPPRL